MVNDVTADFMVSAFFSVVSCPPEPFYLLGWTGRSRKVVVSFYFSSFPNRHVYINHCLGDSLYSLST